MFLEFYDTITATTSLHSMPPMSQSRESGSGYSLLAHDDSSLVTTKSHRIHIDISEPKQANLDLLVPQGRSVLQKRAVYIFLLICMFATSFATNIYLIVLKESTNHRLQQLNPYC
jgi:hypothetical protein